MSEEFDPYHRWLGIPPRDQPPNHYRLLGLELFESDPEVIDAAFRRQIYEFAVFDRVLEPQEILALFRMGELEQPLQL